MSSMTGSAVVRDVPAHEPVPRPRHLGLASGCTIALGALALMVALVMSFAFVAIPALSFIPIPGMAAWLASLLLLMAAVPLAYGVFTLIAGVQLNRGDARGYDRAFTANVLSLAFVLVTIWTGFGLVHGALSGVAMWALSQPDVKAFFGR